MTWITVAAAVAARPRLWPTAVRQMRRTAPRHWYLHWPFLPLPPRGYLAFRLVTQYGDPNHRPEPMDVVNYLSWCRQWDSKR